MRRVLTISYEARSPKTRPAMIQSYRQLMATTRAVLRDAGMMVRRVGQRVRIANRSLWDLIVEWYLRATEMLLRQGLRKDYQERRDSLGVVRGSLVLLPTADAYYAGRVDVVCDFDEFSDDTALNRVLKAAAHAVLAATSLEPITRRRARRLLARMENIGELQPRDTQMLLDRQTAGYADAFLLAIQLLKALGRSFELGCEPTWTFLIRTPDLIESGVRAMLASHLPAHTVVARGQRIPGTCMTLNPDLVLDDGLAVADVKYKLAGEEWKRPDLYQIMTFAEGFRSRNGAILEFCRPGTSRPPSLQIGDIKVRHIGWPADPEVSPSVAEASMIDAMADWLHSCTD
jgi:5-methylcytosine-specific restriction enzyme subunit McrC